MAQKEAVEIMGVPVTSLLSSRRHPRLVSLLSALLYVTSITKAAMSQPPKRNHRARTRTFSSATSQICCPCLRAICPLSSSPPLPPFYLLHRNLSQISLNLFAVPRYASLANCGSVMLERGLGLPRHIRTCTSLRSTQHTNVRIIITYAQHTYLLSDRRNVDNVGKISKVLFRMCIQYIRYTRVSTRHSAMLRTSLSILAGPRVVRSWQCSTASDE